MSRNKLQGYYAGKAKGKHKRTRNRGYALRLGQFNLWSNFVRVLKGYKTGELVIISTGRREGKSMFMDSFFCGGSVEPIRERDNTSLAIKVIKPRTGGNDAMHMDSSNWIIE